MTQEMTLNCHQESWVSVESLVTSSSNPSDRFLFSLGENIKAKFDDEETVRVTVLKAMGEEHILSFKIENEKK